LSKIGLNREIKIKMGKRVGGGEDQSRGGGGEVRGREQAIRD
jgi:hypothetical protein